MEKLSFIFAAGALIILLGGFVAYVFCSLEREYSRHRKSLIGGKYSILETNAGTFRVVETHFIPGPFGPPLPHRIGLPQEFPDRKGAEDYVARNTFKGTS
jgi:hypothetical protein